jgi:hypothetical protein
MKYRLASLATVMLVASSADAYVYNVGPNYVNLPGSSCRAPTSGNENNVYHDTGWTQVKSAVALQRVHCPIVRRATHFYGGKRLDNTYPTEPNNAQFLFNLGGVSLRGTDASTLYKFSCFVFGTRRSDQAIYYGATKTICSSSLGCTPTDVNSSWTGENTMYLAAPTGFSTQLTVNFGVTCDIPAGSSIYYTQASVTPN